MTNSFPVEPPANAQILRGGNKKLKIYFGTNKWGRTEWIGKLFPAGTREKYFLDEYVKSFNAVELHATHYKYYSPSEVKLWTDKAIKQDFKFCPKVTQEISHYSRFVDIQDKTQRFLEGVRAFGEHLGPIFLQVSDRFLPNKKDSLLNYLTSLPKDLQFFVEVRNKEWFVDEEYNSFLKSLSANGIGLILRDKPDNPLRIDLTVPVCFIRFTPTGDLERVGQWYQKIKEWRSKGLQEAYFFVEIEDKTDPLLALNELEYFKKLVQEG